MNMYYSEANQEIFIQTKNICLLYDCVFNNFSLMNMNGVSKDPEVQIMNLGEVVSL